MALTAFDTHELVKDLKAAGFTDDQAEAVTRAVKQAREIDLSDLAAKADLATLATKDGLAAVKLEVVTVSAKLDHMALNYATKAELSELKADLLKWGIGVALGQAALIIALLKLLPGPHP
jgi:hypothetical protein